MILFAGTHKRLGYYRPCTGKFFIQILYIIYLCCNSWIPRGLYWKDADPNCYLLVWNYIEHFSFYFLISEWLKDQMCCSPLSLLVNFYWHFVENDYGFSCGIKEFYLSIRYSLSPFLMIRKCKTHLLALILDFLHLHIYLMTATLFDLFEANGISSYPSNTTWDKNGSILANGICSKA